MEYAVLKLRQGIKSTPPPSRLPLHFYTPRPFPFPFFYFIFPSIFSFSLLPVLNVPGSSQSRASPFACPSPNSRSPPYPTINSSVDIPSHWLFMLTSIRTSTSLCNGSLLKPAVCAPSFDPQKRPSKCKAAGSLTLPDLRQGARSGFCRRISDCMEYLSLPFCTCEAQKVPAACPAVPAYLYHDRSQKWKEAVPPRFHPAAPFFGFLPAQLTEIWPPILVAICGHWLARYQVGSEYCVEDWSHW
ncbi:hypothetical protein BDP67DRAFT_529123 [Colletotrichum lupini]|nr:hypothetical protein BDP67DRAFT_529123 [Colletotrichum lupini]